MRAANVPINSVTYKKSWTDLVECASKSWTELGQFGISVQSQLSTDCVAPYH